VRLHLNEIFNRSDYATDSITGKQGFDSRQSHKIFLSSTASKPTLQPREPSIREVGKTFSTEVNGRSVCKNISLRFPIRLHAVVVKVYVDFSTYIYPKFTLTLPYEYKCG